MGAGVGANTPPPVDEAPDEPVDALPGSPRALSKNPSASTAATVDAAVAIDDVLTLRFIEVDECRSFINKISL